MVVAFLDDNVFNKNTMNPPPEEPEHETTTGQPTTSSRTEKKELVGNRKEFRIDVIKATRKLRIIGNGNRIIVKLHEGILDVIGNFNRVKIIQNNGRVNVIGNNTKVEMGKGSTSTSVQCTGNGIKVKVIPKDVILTKLTTPPPTFPEKTESQKFHSKTEMRSSSVPASPTPTTSSCIFQSSADNIYLSSKNNISLPDLDIVNHLLDLKMSVGPKTCIRISNSMGNIVIKNSCHHQRL